MLPSHNGRLFTGNWSKQKNDEAYGKLRQIIEALNNLDQRPILNVKELFLLADDNQSQTDGLAQTEDAAIASAWSTQPITENRASLRLQKPTDSI